MVRPRKTPEEDYERLAERIWLKGRKKIKNKADYLAVYVGYMKDTGKENSKSLREKVWQKLKIKHDLSDSVRTSEERMKVFNRAGRSKQDYDVKIIDGRTTYVKKG